MLKEILDVEISDKNLVIVCATVIAMTAINLLGVESLGVVGNVISGMFGVAVGKALK